MSTLERCIPPCKSPGKRIEDLSPEGVWASWFSCLLRAHSLTEEERMAERQKDWARSEETQCWGCSVTDGLHDRGHLVAQSHQTLCDPVDCSAPGSSDQGDSPGKNTGVRRRKWQSTPVHLPGKSHGRRRLVGYIPRGCKESDMTE